MQFYGWAYRTDRAHADARTGAARKRDRIRRKRAVARKDGDRVRRSRSLRRISQAVHEWLGTRILTVTPIGTVLPCPAAAAIRTLLVRERARPLVIVRKLGWNLPRLTPIAVPRGWRTLALAQRRERDWGGCRCQAFLLTGDAAATDPACHLSPDHTLVVQAREPKDEPLLQRADDSARPWIGSRRRRSE